MKLKSLTAALLLLGIGMLITSCSRSITPYEAAQGHKHGRKCQVLR